VARTKKIELAENRLGCKSLGVGETVAVLVVVYCSNCRSCEAVRNGEQLANGESQYWCKNPHYGRDDLSQALSRQRYEREPCNHNKTNKEIKLCRKVQ
jgi:hypothetical protein